MKIKIAGLALGMSALLPLGLVQAAAPKNEAAAPAVVKPTTQDVAAAAIINAAFTSSLYNKEPLSADLLKGCSEVSVNVSLQFEDKDEQKDLDALEAGLKTDDLTAAFKAAGIEVISKEQSATAIIVQVYKIPSDKEIGNRPLYVTQIAVLGMVGNGKNTGLALLWMNSSMVVQRSGDSDMQEIRADVRSFVKTIIEMMKAK